MSDIQLDTLTNDISLSGGDLQIVLLDAAIRQSLLQRLRLFLGEWFLATDKGVPYYQSILVKNPNLDLIQATLLTVIRTTPGITDVTEFEFGYDNASRNLSVEFNARSTNGTIISIQTSVGA